MPELRKDPVVGRWVIIATERARRPSDFVTEPVRPRASACAFCEGHEQQTPPEILAGRPPDGRPNGPGWTYRVVPNKFPALRIEGELEPSGEGLFDRMNGVGAHEVVIETPRHDASLAGLSVDAVADVLFAFRERMLDLKKDPRFAYVLVFKNHGGVAETLGEILRRMNQVLGEPPFNFMLHTAPFREAQLESFHWHLEVIPKLTRVAGFEWGSGFFFNPVPPEDAADALRAGTSRS